MGLELQRYFYFLMKASDLPVVPGADHFFVRGPYSWGRGPTVADAIKAAQVRHMQIVHVARVDAAASCHSIDGSMLYTVRGDVWEGRVWGKDITLKKVTHPMKNAAEGRSSASL